MTKQLITLTYAFSSLSLPSTPLERLCGQNMIFHACDFNPCSDTNSFSILYCENGILWLWFSGECLFPLSIWQHELQTVVSYLALWWYGGWYTLQARGRATHFIWWSRIGQARLRMSPLLNSGIAWQGHVFSPCAMLL